MANYTVVDCTAVYCVFRLRLVEIHFVESERNTIFNTSRGMYKKQTKKIPNAGLTGSLYWTFWIRQSCWLTPEKNTIVKMPNASM